MMYVYLVHLVRQDIKDWALNVRIEADRTPLLRFYNSTSPKIDSFIPDEERNPGKAETWYSDDPMQAEALARKIAYDFPGREVNVYKLVSVHRSAPNTPTKAIFTEKGLIPV